MSPNINGVVLEIDAQIFRLKELRERLIEFAGQSPALPAAVQAVGPTESEKAEVGKRKQKRGGRQKVPSSREIPSAKSAAALVTGGKVSTVAGAMKREIAGMKGREFTTEGLRGACEAKYGEEDWWKNASASAMSGNLSYWSSKGRLDKTATGYKAADAAFFENVEY